MSLEIDIRPDHLRIVRDILRRHLPPGTALWAFGSRTTGKARPTSDLDLAVDAGRVLTAREHTLLADSFDESDLPYKVDVIDLQRTSARFRAIVGKSRVPLEDAPL